MESQKHIYDVDLYEVKLHSLFESLSETDINDKLKQAVLFVIEEKKRSNSPHRILNYGDDFFEFSFALFLYANKVDAKLILNHHFRKQNDQKGFVNFIEFRIKEILKYLKDKELLSKVSDWIYDKHNNDLKTVDADFDSFPSLFKSQQTFQKLLTLLSDYEIIDKNNNWVGLTDKLSETSIFASHLVDVKCTYLHTHKRELVRGHFNNFFNYKVSKSSFANNPSKFADKVLAVYQNIFKDLNS